MAWTFPKRGKRTAPLPAQEWLTAGPFRGMRDAPEATTADPTLALFVGNMASGIGPQNAGLSARPGFEAMGSSALGAVGVRGGQAVLTWTDYGGTRQTTAICGGKVYSYDWNTDTQTNVVTAANLATASITLSTTARVALVPFADGLVVSDGVNTPFWWDGTAGAGGLVKMTNAPVFYGPPTVYYSRLVGIKLASSLHFTMVWSEPGAPNTGYEAGGYNNAWDNPGGYSDPLQSVCGTNEALYVFRERVSLAITGAVTSDWATAGTRANLSTTIGTLSPWATLAVTQGVLIVDADARPWLMRFGALEPVNIWSDCAQTIAGTPRASLMNVQTVEDDATRSVLIGLPEIGQTNITQWLCYDVETLQFVGVWSWAEATQRCGRVIDGDGVARWAHCGVDDGRFYAHGTPSGPWDDELQSGTAIVSHQLVATTLGYDLDREYVFDQIEGAVTTDDVSTVSVSYETPRGVSVPLDVQLVGNGVGMNWDVDNWDEANWAGATRDSRFRCGVLGRGRWIRPAMRHAVMGEPFSVTVMRVRAISHSGNPKEP